MFLLISLFVVVVVYAVSALVGELVFASACEKKMPTAVRVGFGYFLSLVFFAGAWLLMPIQQAWVLGAAMLVLYLLGIRREATGGRLGAIIKERLPAHAKLLGAFLLLANLFFLPLHLAGNFGPFTEGGGDITVYSDVAKRLTDSGLTATGLSSESELSERVRYIKYLIKRTIPERYMAMEDSLVNPPAADWQLNKLAFNLQLNPIQYTPFAQYAMLTGDNNYPVYFGIGAFLYGCILLSAWAFFRRYGQLAALLAVLITGASHSLISAFYNMYALETLSITCLYLLLAALPYIRLFSLAGLKTYGVIVAYVAVAYGHFLPIFVPFLLVAAVGWTDVGSGPAVIKAKGAQRLFRILPAAILFAFVALFVVVGIEGTVSFIKGAVNGAIQGISLSSSNSYMGDRVPVLSLRWMSYLFGVASQQHFQPYMVERLVMTIPMLIAVAVGLAIVMLGLLTIYKLHKSSSGHADVGYRRGLAIYAAALLAIVAYSMVAQTSQYTQAKSAQYLLPCLYLVLLVPFALLQQYAESQATRLKRVYANALLAFFVMLGVPRLVFAYQLADQSDRSSILESSYFGEANKIRKEDSAAFVYFEPRKSGDLYLGNQPFSGGKMLPTRHLVLFKYDRETYKRDWSIASDFLPQADLPHLWWLSATKDEGGAYIWKAKRMMDVVSPTIYLFGDDYELNFGQRPRGKAVTTEVGMFSYLRNGEVTLLLPRGSAGEVEIMIEPRDSNRFGELLSEVTRRLAAGELAGASVTSNEGFVTLKRRFAAEDSPRLVRLVRFGNEYWANVRWNGKEIGRE